MKRTIRIRTISFALALILCLTVSAFASRNFGKTVSLTGSSAVTVSSLMTANGAPVSLTLSCSELTIRNEGAGTLYFGDADVATKGVALTTGQSYTWRSSGYGGDYSISPSNIYLYTASTQSVVIVAWGVGQ